MEQNSKKFLIALVIVASLVLAGCLGETGEPREQSSQVSNASGADIERIASHEEFGFGLHQVEDDGTTCYVYIDEADGSSTMDCMEGA